MDAQVIVTTDPHYDQAWNDGDFVIALMLFIREQVRSVFFKKTLPKIERLEIKMKALKKLRSQCSKGLSADEIEVLDSVFPGSYQKNLDELIDEAFERLPKIEQIRFYRQELVHAFSDYPDFSLFIDELKQLYPFLIKYNQEQLKVHFFPTAFNHADPNALLKYLVFYYKTKVLSSRVRKKLHEHFAAQGNPDSPKVLHHVFLKHLAQSPQLKQILKRFLSWLVCHSSQTDLKGLPHILEMLSSKFPAATKTLASINMDDLFEKAKSEFRYAFCQLIKVRKEVFSRQLEAQSEYGLLLKIQKVEQYLTEKYPDTEVHFFLNILRRMRNGDHTPFLVSPEGSQAYSLMLNDFLLNKLKQVTDNFCVGLMRIPNGIQTSKRRDIKTITPNFGIRALVLGLRY